MNNAAQPAGSLFEYLVIARFNHWFKQVFCLPGLVLAVALEGVPVSMQAMRQVLVAFLAVGFTASSNYVINEILDARSDREHPEKRYRPIPSGKVKVGAAYAEWLFLGALGVSLAWTINQPFLITTVSLWVMGLVYNIPPLRAKDLPVGDVLCESINNPIRLLMGWYAMGATGLAPLSLLCPYWMFGAFLMTAKRFAEYRHIGDKEKATRYRRCFRRYTEKRLLALMVFFVNTFSLLLGVFLIKYRVELILLVPLIAVLIAVYWELALRPDSPVQVPEKLYREGWLMIVCALVAIVGTALLFIDLPFLADFFEVGVAAASV